MNNPIQMPREAQLFYLASLTAHAVDKHLIKRASAVKVLREVRKLSIEFFEELCQIYLKRIKEESGEEKLTLFLGSALRDIELKQRCLKAYNNGVRYLLQGDDYYPELLETIPAPPGILFIKGNMIFQSTSWQKNTVTVIGTRKASNYGLRIARILGDEIAGNGGVVVSGLAYGIDAEVQKAAVERQGRVIAVLASSLDSVYPAEHQSLFEAICQNGLAISEHPPGAKLYRNYFPARNRIMSGLSALTVVIESSQRSGTLITVEQALAQGRDVWAVPGSIYSPQSKGVNKLIADGAMVLHDFDSFIQEMYSQGVFPGIKKKSIDKYSSIMKLDTVSENVLSLLTETSASAESIAKTLNLNESEVFEIISNLENFVRIHVSNGEFILT